MRGGDLITGTLFEAYLYDNAGQQTKACLGSGVSRSAAGVTPATCGGSLQTTYAYDSLGHLAQVAGSSSASHRYDPQGRRIQKTENGTTTNYLYDGQDLHAEYTTGWGNPQAVYVQAGTDRPLARLTGQTNLPTATAAYYHADGLGSVVATSNAAQAATASQRFDAFGVKLASVGSIAQYGYTGREPDASGLVYYRARYYDPNLGRFTQRDPIGFAGGLNPYAYVGNNPVNFNDPSGLWARAVGNQATQAATYFGSTVQQLGWGGAAQFGLDVLATSEVPVVSQGAGLIGAGVYAYQGDTVGALSSLGGMVPGIGTISDAGRLGRWGVKLEEASQQVIRQVDNLPGPVLNVVANKPFALGIDTHLDDFARQHNATTWKQLDDVENWKPQVLDRITDPEQKVLFNLDGVDIWGGVSRAASGRGGATDWELLQVRQNPQAWDTIEFFQNGSRVGNPFQ